MLNFKKMKMMIQNIVRTIFLCGIVFLLLSCDDYLSEEPGRGSDEPLSSSEQLDGLLDNAYEMMYETSPTLCFSTDDFGATKELVQSFPNGFAWSDALTYFTWSVDDIENTTSNNCWEEQYSKIFTANLIINQIDNVTDLTSVTRQNYLSEAHFIRAYSYWFLVNHYAMPYAAENMEEPGVPLKLTTSYEESLDRQTIKDAYELIESDLQEALKTNVTEVKDRWRISRPAVEAYLSRYYLFTGDYEQVVEHAANALAATGVKLEDYNTMVTVSDEVWGNDGTVELIYPEIYRYAPGVYTDYEEFYYTRFLQNWSNPEFFPSEDLLALYDRNNDMRFKLLMVNNGAIANQIYNDEENFQYVKFKTSWGDGLLPSGPTIAELILNKAEAEARLGNFQEAMITLNLLREKRMKTGSDYELSATGKENAIKKVLEERRRELPFVMRWYDIRRFAYNETTIDDVALEFDFFVVENQGVDYSQTVHYSLPVKSRRYAVPISQEEINLSQGQIKQNQY